MLLPVKITAPLLKAIPVVILNLRQSQQDCKQDETQDTIHDAECATNP